MAGFLRWEGVIISENDTKKASCFNCQYRPCGRRRQTCMPLPDGWSHGKDCDGKDYGFATCFDCTISGNTILQKYCASLLMREIKPVLIVSELADALRIRGDTGNKWLLHITCLSPFAGKHRNSFPGQGRRGAPFTLPMLSLSRPWAGQATGSHRECTSLWETTAILSVYDYYPVRYCRG